MKKTFAAQPTELDPEDVRRMARGLNDVGFGLQRRLPGDGNLVFSPVSVWATLLTLVPGARGRTLEELREALVSPDGPPSERLPGLAGVFLHVLGTRVLPDVPFRDPETGKMATRDVEVFRMDIASAAWAATGYPLLDSYVDALRTDLGASVDRLDFHKPGEASARINAWVRKRTEDRIPSLVDPDLIQPLTRLILTNATYFKAEWESGFSEDDTQPATFHALDGDVEVEMMSQTTDFDHVRHEIVGVDVVRMPYSGGMHALLILPAEGELDRLESRLDDATLRNLTKGLERKDVRLSLPRFEIDSGSLSLGELLPASGIRAAFTDGADFSGITPDPDGLKLSEVVHRCWMAVDEAGTEATAGTAGTLLTLSAEPMEPVTVVADRPFLFLVQDPWSRSVLFSARVVDPTG